MKKNMDPRVAVRSVPPTPFTRAFLEAGALVATKAFEAAERYDRTRRRADLLSASAALLRAVVLTDNRCPVETDTYRCLGVDDACWHLTEDPAEVGHGLLRPLPPDKILILAKDALVCVNMGNHTAAMRALNELVYQLADGDPADLDLALCDDPSLAPHCHGLTGQELRFAVHTLGVKVGSRSGKHEANLPFAWYHVVPTPATNAKQVCRRLYRMPEQQRETCPGLAPPVTAALLRYVERFGERQVEVDAASPVGHLNKGWVCMERKQWAAAAGHYAAALKLADARGSDIAMGTSRVDLCGCLVWGSANAATVDVFAVEKLFGEVKPICARLSAWHMDVFVHGESMCGDVVKVFLAQHKGTLAEGRRQVAGGIKNAVPGSLQGWVPSLTACGLKPSDRRDQGSFGPKGEAATGVSAKVVCAHCRRSFVKTLACSRCKVARYCGPDCQSAAWPAHKAACLAAGGNDQPASKSKQKKEKARRKAQEQARTEATVLAAADQGGGEGVPLSDPLDID